MDRVNESLRCFWSETNRCILSRTCPVVKTLSRCRKYVSPSLWCIELSRVVFGCVCDFTEHDSCKRKKKINVFEFRPFNACMTFGLFVRFDVAKTFYMYNINLNKTWCNSRKYEPCAASQLRTFEFPCTRTTCVGGVHTKTAVGRRNLKQNSRFKSWNLSLWTAER